MSEFKQQLMNDLIVVQLQEEPPTRIKLPDWQRTLRGTVIATGPGKMLYSGERAEMMTQVGDLVSFGAATGMDTSYGGHTNVRMMKDTDVDAVLEQTVHKAGCASANTPAFTPVQTPCDCGVVA